MKQMVRKMLVSMFSVMVLIILIIVAFIQSYHYRVEYKEQSDILFDQVKHILEKNSLEKENVVADYKQICLNYADAVAYILNENSTIIEDMYELRKIAGLLQVDEIHIFNDSGEIVKGTEPNYYGCTVYDGEQIGYFAEMLDNKELRLCQDVTPNTTDNKEMQYAAVWSIDKTYFIQVGTSPERVLEVISKNQLSYIFSLLTSDDSSKLYAVDDTTRKILGSTNSDVVGQEAENIGFTMEQITQEKGIFSCKVLGKTAYCIADKYDNIILIRTLPIQDLYSNFLHDIGIMASCLICIAIVAIYLMERFLDKNIVHGIYDINKVLMEGDINQLVKVDNTPEFELLSDCINRMKRNLAGTIERMSYVLDHASLPMGVYEYNSSTNTVQVTKQVTKILNLNEDMAKDLFSNRSKFEAFLEKIRSNPIKEFNDTYMIQSDTGQQYVRMECFEKEGEIIGILIDVTSNVLRSKKMEKERDIDMLTGIYNRRAFEAILDKLYEEPEAIKHSALIMLDADGLKQLNDKYGHRIGDEYLCELVNQVNHISPENTLFSRQGGDEFVIFHYGCETNEELMNYINALSKLRDKKEFPIEDDKTVKIRYSFGYILCHGRKESYADLLREADLKMYEEKKKRKKEEVKDTGWLNGNKK